MKTLYLLNLITTKRDERDECKTIITIFESYDFTVLVALFSSLFEIINPVFTAHHENNDLQKASILLSNFLNKLSKRKSKFLIKNNLKNQNVFYTLLNEPRDLAKEWNGSNCFQK